MLAVKNLEVVYQDVILVLRGISFEIPKGEIVSLLGSNGSGKTTALRAITGLLDTQNGDITKGQILVEDEDITNAEPSKIVNFCLLYTSPSPRDQCLSRMPSSA